MGRLVLATLAVSCCDGRLVAWLSLVLASNRRAEVSQVPKDFNTFKQSRVQTW